MKVKVIKEGKWALRGVDIVDIETGVQDLSNELAKELLSSGWAEEVGQEPKEEDPKPIKKKKIRK